MKIVRYKKVQRYLSFYCNNFGFRAPYQVLIDGTFCFAARKEQINIKEQIPKYLVGEVKLLTTKCVLIEAEKIAKKVMGALTILKQFALHECGHKDPISGADCIHSMVGKSNTSHYIVATQDRALQDQLRNSSIGVPLLYLHLKAPTLERPSELSSSVAQKKQEQLLSGLNSTQEEILKQLKEKSGLPTEEVNIKKKKKRRGGPNPLSCLKKKKKQNVPKSQSQKSSGKIKKRKRIKLPSHVKEALKGTK